jgi:phage shock protein C
MNRRLYRSRTDTMLGGVAAGVAEYLDIDPTIVRIIWVILAIVTGGIFVVLYIVMWIIVPEAPIQLPPAGQTATAAPGGAPTPEGQPTPSASVPPPQAPPGRRRGSGSGPMIVGLILIGVGAWFLVAEFFPQIDTDLLWPIALVILGVVLLGVSLQRRNG